MLLVGDEFPMEFGGPQMVEELQWTVEKLVQVVIEAEEVRSGLPTGGWCAAGEEGDGGGGMQLKHCNLDVVVSQTASGRGGGAAAREGGRVNAPRRPVHGDQEVAAGGSLGLPWRARVRPPGERKEVEAGRGGRVGGVAAGGGARMAVPAVNGGDRSSAEGGSGGGQRRKKQRAVRRTIL
jgi:hypothetical protein